MDERSLSELEAALRHRFQHPETLERALTHRSSLAEFAGGGSGVSVPDAVKEDNEKLEFLGDAVLGLVVSEYLVRMFPEWTEGQLSRGRAKLVNGAALYEAAQRLRLGRFLRLGRGEEKTGGREKPALLADAYEALVAALYLDAGLDAARCFVQDSLLREGLRDLAERLGTADHKSALQELLQARGEPPAEYRVIGESGPDHQKRFLVEVWLRGVAAARGTGGSKKEAEQEAAHRALAQLRSESE